ISWRVQSLAVRRCNRRKILSVGSYFGLVPSVYTSGEISNNPSSSTPSTSCGCWNESLLSKLYTLHLTIVRLNIIDIHQWGQVYHGSASLHSLFEKNEGIVSHE